MSIGQIDVTVINQPTSPSLRRPQVMPARTSESASRPEAYLAGHGLAWFRLKR